MERLALETTRFIDSEGENKKNIGILDLEYVGSIKKISHSTAVIK